MPFSQFSTALDAVTTDIRVFFRDDDAGWADERLMTLLDVFDEQRAPIDLAVIPQALTRELALELCMRRARAREYLGLHQHGYAHTNHQSEGRKCEFGAARSAEQQAQDVMAGHERLGALLGRIDPIFTPPWNRCTQATVAALRECGLKVLSRDFGAAPLELGALRDAPVHVDWCKWTNTQTPDWASLDQQLGLAVERAVPAERDKRAVPAGTDKRAVPAGTDKRAVPALGVMLHHAVMGDADWQALRELLALLYRYPRVRLSLMRELISTKRRAEATQAALHV
jgi:peptidoglycan/xylan/chitin deacetylase (PgdA/CDA1 family)